MRHLTYLLVLVVCLLGTAPLEIFLRVGVYRRWRRLALAVLPGLILGIAWDAYAVSAGHWHFDRRYLIGLPVGNLPIEEVLFFVVIPVCAVLTFEAVRRRRPTWLVGDEQRDEKTGPADDEQQAARDKRSTP